MAHLINPLKHKSRANAPLASLIKSYWNLPKEIQDDCLSDYFVQKLTKRTFEDSFDSRTETILYNGIPFLVIHAGDGSLNPKYPVILASFRREKGYPFGYVLIKDFKTSRVQEAN